MVAQCAQPAVLPHISEMVKSTFVLGKIVLYERLHFMDGYLSDIFYSFQKYAPFLLLVYISLLLFI